MSVALVTGSAGLIGSEAVRHFAGLGLDVVGIDNDMRAAVLRRRRRRPRGTCCGSPAELGDAYTHHDIDIRDRDALAKIFRHVRQRHRRRDPHRRAAVARLGGSRPVHRLRRQRRRHAQRPAERPGALHRGAGHPLLDQQGLRRPAQLAAAGRAGDPLGDRPGAPVRATASARTCRSTPACTRSSAPPRSPPT